METSRIKELVRNREVQDPTLHSILFTEVVKSSKGTGVSSPLLEEYNELSKQLDYSEVQAATSVRNVLLARRLATYLMDDQGEIDTKRLVTCITELQENLYSLGPNRQHDSRRRSHILQVLQWLKGSESIKRLLKKIDKPYANPRADRIIRETLQLSKETGVTYVHARRAALSALLTFLRQSVGSCFATAPAILIHDEQPEQFLKDINELLATGRLKRTFGGVEYTAPLSFSWGAGDLRRRVSFPETPIWHSPGLINALAAVKQFPETMALPEKRTELKKKIEEAIAFAEISPEGAFLNVEEIIRLILLKAHHLREEELQEYLSRPHEMIHSSLLMHVPKADQQGASLGARSSSFLDEFEIAKSAFKALSDNALLKAWEYTVATFTETKSNFSKWNLYVSLGFKANEPGGLGAMIYTQIQERLEEEKRKLEEAERNYENVYTVVKHLEGRLRRATEEERRYLRPELQARVNEFSALEDLRNKIHYRAVSFANLFDVLIYTYLALFPKYFQEIYDPDMHHVTESPYDDSPAGFQLIYKHGRTTTSSWTAIHSLSDFVNALTSFFTATEHEVVNDPTFKGFEQDISSIISHLIAHVRSFTFQESAFFRMAREKGGYLPEKPLENLEKIEKKPWGYTSGGSLETLLQCYYKRNEPPHEVERWIENPTELLVFLLDTLRAMPHKITEEAKSLLATSPTHAFVVKPQFPLFKAGWATKEYTYTWCRDRLILPRQHFLERISLDEQMIHYLLGRLMETLPNDLHHFFRKAFAYSPRRMNPMQWREHVVKTVSYDTALSRFQQTALHKDKIDALLYAELPLFHNFELKTRVQAILSTLPNFPLASAMAHVQTIIDETTSTPILSSATLCSLCKAVVVATLSRTFTPVDFAAAIDKAAQDLSYALPAPILFADTNWVEGLFGFTVNPGTGQFELFRFDDAGTNAKPMSIWKQWLDGSDKRSTWSLYSKPHQYQM